MRSSAIGYLWSSQNIFIIKTSTKMTKWGKPCGFKLDSDMAMVCDGDTAYIFGFPWKTEDSTRDAKIHGTHALKKYDTNLLEMAKGCRMGAIDIWVCEKLRQRYHYQSESRNRWGFRYKPSICANFGMRPWFPRGLLEQEGACFALGSIEGCTGTSAHTLHYWYTPALTILRRPFKWLLQKAAHKTSWKSTARIKLGLFLRLCFPRRTNGALNSWASCDWNLNEVLWHCHRNLNKWWDLTLIQARSTVNFWLSFVLYFPPMADLHRQNLRSIAKFSVSGMYNTRYNSTGSNSIVRGSI